MPRRALAAARASLRVPTEPRRSLLVRRIWQLSLPPQDQPESQSRVIKMVEAMDREGFGNCTMHRECEAVCPKSISVNFIARMNREYLRSLLKGVGLP